MDMGYIWLYDVICIYLMYLSRVCSINTKLINVSLLKGNRADT